MIKRFLAAVLALSLLGGCTPINIQKDDTLTVICTVFPPYDFVQAIAPDVTVSLLLSPGQESHSYEPTPQDIIAIQNCDLFVYVGGESEAWVEDLLGSMDTPPRALSLLECVGIQDAHTHDEHVWTLPSNAVSIVEALCDTLCSLAPNKAAETEKATEAYVEKLNA